MRFQRGQVLYGSRRTYLRKVALADFEGICANTTLVLETKSADLLQEFLPHVMSTERFHAHSISKSKGSVNPYINFIDLNDYEFALPPIAEQHRIIKLMSAIDESMKRLETVDLHSFISSFFREFVNQKSSDWCATTIGSVAVCAGGTAFPHAYQGGNTGVPFFKVGDMNKVENQRELCVSNNYVTLDEIRSLGGRVWPKGTVVFPKVGAALATEKRRILGQESLFDNNIMGLVPTNEIIPEYLFLIMRNIKMRDFVQDGAVPSVNNKIVGSIPIDLPPLKEQERFLVFMSQIETLSIHISKSLDNLKILRRSLLSDVFGKWIQDV
jgi:type I restriction enzyme S subunit